MKRRLAWCGLAAGMLFHTWAVSFGYDWFKWSVDGFTSYLLGALMALVIMVSLVFLTAGDAKKEKERNASTANGKNHTVIDEMRPR